MATRHTSRLDKETADQKLIEGTNKHLAQLGSLPVGNGMYTAAELVQMLQNRIATSQGVTAATAQRTAAVKTDRERQAQSKPVIDALRRVVQGMFSEMPDTLVTFGLAPIKVASKSVATKNAAVAKARATRAARHTMGPRQKAKVTGETVDEGSASPPPAAATSGTTAPAAHG